jgi:O-6-methylguanine DNA methyltransferase
MLPFLALHAIAAPRGEGLRPELLKGFRHIAGNPEFDFPSTKRGQTASSARRPDSSALGFIEGPEKGLDQAIDVRGTPFRQRVWGALLGIPAGSMVTYAALAARIGEPKSARPVANACADIADALAIPRHRVLSKLKPQSRPFRCQHFEPWEGRVGRAASARHRENAGAACAGHRPRSID